jgi:hypothetical protein
MFRNRWGLSATALLLVVAAAGFSAQLITGRPVLGALGLLLLGVPGFVISQTARPLPVSWPEVALVTLGTTLILTILVGIVAALSPHGLDASGAAAVELVAVALAVVLWRSARLARSREGGARRAAIRIPRAPASVLVATVGLILAGSGFVVAARSAQTQEYGGFVQFWTVPSTTAGGALVGVRNATGSSIDCSISVIRPSQQPFDIPAGAVQDGQSWSGQLPPRDAGDISPWQLALRCVADDGSVVERRLFTEPAAS